VKKSTARSPFPWFGGKQKLADDIIGLFPPHNVYVEVFGGGGSVLLSKTPSTLDVYNDVDDGLVCFFTCLRDEPERLIALLELTPYSRSSGSGAARPGRIRRSSPSSARAAGTSSRVRASAAWSPAAARDGADASQCQRRPAGWKADRHPNGERHHGRGWGGERLGRMHLSRAASTANRIDNIWRFVERMRLVQIENLDWRACIDRYDDVPTRSSTSTRPTSRRRGAPAATTTS
jgi:hypothetical protein